MSIIKKISDSVGATRVRLLCCVVDNINAVVDLIIIVEYGNEIDENNFTIDGLFVAVCGTKE